MKKNVLYPSLLLGVLLYLWSCTHNQINRGEVTPSTQLYIGLEKAEAVAASKPNFRSLLVSVDNKLILEKYYKPYGRDSLDHLRSATKSIMTTLIGIAIDRGLIPNMDVSISDYLSVPSPEKAEITIKHLASMTSGLEWDEGIGYNDNNEMIDSGTPIQYVLNKPLVHPPGSKWNYSTGDIHVLSAILTKTSGLSTLHFARSYLFEPLGIQRFKLQKFEDNFYSGGSRLELKPKDMLKIGQLFANSGVHDGKRLVSEAFIDEATTLQNPTGAFKSTEEGYGYGWWVGHPMGLHAFMASGYAGQTIAVVPELQLVIVTTQKWQVNGQQAVRQQDDVQEIAKWVVEAVLQEQKK